MTRSNSSGHHSGARRQRQSASELHQQHQRRSTDRYPPLTARVLRGVPLQRAPLSPRVPRPASRSRPSPRRRQYQQQNSSPRKQNSSPQKQRRELFPNHQKMALEDRYESPEATDYKLERRREADKRLSLPPRPLDLVLYKPPGGRENHRRSPGNRASSSLDLIGQSPATSGGSDDTTTSVQRLQQKVAQLQRAATRESNRTAELTRLNAVVLQRNKTIAELQRENTALRGENVRVCGALAARTEMAVALHGIGGRQQEFMRSFGGAVYADAGQRRGFEAWVQSNELYMMHVREEISGERRWEEVVAKANAMAMREIGRLAHQAAHDAAQRAVQQMAQQGGQPSAQQVAQQIMQQASLQHFGP